MIKISVANDFSITPGARYKDEGSFSGESFRDDVLIPALKRAKDNNEKVEIDFDGCYGFATSFLEETFGGLVRKEKRKGVLNNIVLISNDDDTLVDLIKQYVKREEDKL